MIFESPPEREIPFAWGPVLREAAASWYRSRSPYAAAIAYAAMFAIAPLLLIALAAAGEFYGREAASGQLRTALTDFLGPDGAALLADLISRSSRPADNLGAAIVGIGVLVWAVYNLTFYLKLALNQMWGLDVQQRTVWQRFLSQIIATFIVIASGCLLLGSLIANVWVASVAKPYASWIPSVAVVALSDLLVSLAAQATLLSILLKYLPEAQVPWRAAAIGGLATTAMLHVGKTLFTLYLSHAAIKATYGAAASVVVLLLWAYYSSQMFLLGAEITRVATKALAARRTRDAA